MKGRIPIRIPRAEWLAFGKSLKNAFSASMLGDVTLVFMNGVLSVNTSYGGTTLACEGEFNGVVIVKAGAFKKLITTHLKKKSDAPWIVGAVDLELGELSLWSGGVKAKFLS